MKDLLVRLSSRAAEGNVVRFEQFAVLFYSTMLRAALINLKAYIDRTDSKTPLELRLLEYKRTTYLKAIANSPAEVKILKALIDHRSKCRLLSVHQ